MGHDENNVKKISREIKEVFPSNYINVYEEFDSLERNKDVSGLLDVLIKHKTHRIRPNFTLNNIVANPNFTEIITVIFLIIITNLSQRHYQIIMIPLQGSNL